MNGLVSTTASDGGGSLYVWIGGKETTEGTYVWSDNPTTSFWTNGSGGSSVGGAYQNWGRSASSAGGPEPDNYLGTQNRVAMALERWPASLSYDAIGQAGQWNDIQSGDLLYYLIEWTPSQALTLSVPASFSVEATDNIGAVVTYANATTPVNVAGGATITYSKPSGSIFTIGPTTVTATAVDTDGNTVTGSFVVTVTPIIPVAQTISFPPIADRSILDGNLTLSATSSSGLAVTYSIVSGPGTVSGNTVSFTGLGTVTVLASQAGSLGFNPATNVERTITVTKSAQTITFASIAAHTIADNSFNISATASSGLPVTLSLVSGPATLAGNTITLTGSQGTVVIAANQAGDASYNGATAQVSIPINGLPQTIAFNPIANVTLDAEPFSLSATASSGLPVSFSVSGPATILNNTLTVSGTGVVTVTATQAGNDRYAPADSVQRGFTVSMPPLSTNANLSRLELNSGALIPSFSLETTAYGAKVPFSARAISVSPTAADPRATIRVRLNGGSYASVVTGGMSAAHRLQVGENDLEVKVTAPDGVTTRTYAVTVTRSALGADWSSVACGKAHTVGLKMDGTLWAWGANNSGQLGDGTTGRRGSPFRVGTADNWSSMACGDSHTMAIKTDGTLWGWGNNSSGQLGDGSVSRRTSPAQVGDESHWKAVSCGNSHTVALKNDGTLWAWGENSRGQLGGLAGTQSRVPVQVGDGSDWAFVACGAFHTVAIKNDGTLWAWGHNAGGQLGDGTTTQSFTGVRVGDSSDWVSAAVGAAHTLALKRDGTLWAWGSNSLGQLGNGGGKQSNSPVQVGEGNDWGFVASGFQHAAALKTDGAIWVWGDNSSGQLGDGSFLQRGNPVGASAAHDWKMVACGQFYTVALKNDGTLWAWGSNMESQLGAGVMAKAATAVKVISVDTPVETVPVLRNPSVSGVSETGVTLGGMLTTSDQSGILEHGLVYALSSINNNPIIDGLGVIKVLADDNSGAFTVALRGLQEGSLYSFKMFATNREGTGYSSVASFRTQLGTNANLSELTLNGATLNVGFSSQVNNYSAHVANAVQSISLNAASVDPNANVQVRINGGSLVSLSDGETSAELPLREGNNALEVRVTAQDGVTKKGYLVTIQRAASGLGMLAGATFDGLLVPSQGIGGSVIDKYVLLNVTTTSAGMFSGKLQTVSGVATLSGQITEDGAVVFGARNVSSVNVVSGVAGLQRVVGALSLRVDFGGEYPEIRAELVDTEDGESVLSQGTLRKAVYSALETLPFGMKHLPEGIYSATKEKGVYTVLIDLPEEVRGYTDEESGREMYAQGSGFGRMIVSASGAVSFIGKLADGTSISCSNRLSATDQWSLHVPLYSKKGLVAGVVTFDPTDLVADARGVGMRWFKPAGQGTSAYPLGWSEGVAVNWVGAKYVAPRRVTVVDSNPGTVFGEDVKGGPVSEANLQMVLQRGGMPQDSAYSANLNASSVLTVLGASVAEQLKVTFTSTTGCFTASFRHPVTGKMVTGYGAVSQKEKVARGYFLSPSASASDSPTIGLIQIFPFSDSNP